MVQHIEQILKHRGFGTTIETYLSSDTHLQLTIAHLLAGIFQNTNLQVESKSVSKLDF